LVVVVPDGIIMGFSTDEEVGRPDAMEEENNFMLLPILPAKDGWLIIGRRKVRQAVIDVDVAAPIVIVLVVYLIAYLIVGDIVLSTMPCGGCMCVGVGVRRRRRRAEGEVGSRNMK